MTIVYRSYLSKLPLFNNPKCGKFGRPTPDVFLKVLCLVCKSAGI